MPAAKKRRLGAKAYRLVPKGRFRKAWKALGLDGFELEVTGTALRKRVKIVNCIPQGGCRPPFSKKGCDGIQHFMRKKGSRPRPAESKGGNRGR
jgi:hypothetical protein